MDSILIRASLILNERLESLVDQNIVGFVLFGRASWFVGFLHIENSTISNFPMDK